MRRLLALAVAAALCLPSIALARSPRQPTPFDKGRMRIGIQGGTTSSFDNTYFVLGGVFGYFIADGLELALGGSMWIGDDPSIAELSPQVRYVVYQVPVVKPYAGAFYEHIFLGEVGGLALDDVDSIGARGGLLFQIGRAGFLGAGVSYASRVNCNEDQLGDFCDARLLPEISFSLFF
ncbi:MAG: hypothetical protein KC613_06145 [Myxococcales bacterium]|nr:hypothetical protein [Myxococcales bacterium]MCB9522028.1 hypothetical protein [Myxococcales bacterium]